MARDLGRSARPRRPRRPRRVADRRLPPREVQRRRAHHRVHGHAPDGFASVEGAAKEVSCYKPHRPPPKDLRGLTRKLRRRDDGRYASHWDPAFIEGRHTTTERMHNPDLLSEEGAQTFLAQVSHTKLVDVSGAGHRVAGDKNDAFTEAVIDFLKTSLDD